MDSPYRSHSTHFPPYFPCQSNGYGMSEDTAAEMATNLLPSNTIDNASVLAQDMGFAPTQVARSCPLY